MERVALLENLLKDHRLPIPPAHYPSETRHCSYRSSKISSINGTCKSSATSKERSLVSSDMASSPCSTGSETANKDSISRKRVLHFSSTSNDCRDAGKKPRKESLNFVSDVKVESPLEIAFGSNILYEKTRASQDSTMMPTSSRSPSWSKVDAYADNLIPSSLSTLHAIYSHSAHST